VKQALWVGYLRALTYGIGQTLTPMSKVDLAFRGVIDKHALGLSREHPRNVRLRWQRRMPWKVA